MAEKEVIVWTCDCCGVEQGSPNKKSMPPAWSVLKVEHKGKILIIKDLCPLCLSDVEKAMKYPTRNKIGA